MNLPIVEFDKMGNIRNYHALYDAAMAALSNGQAKKKDNMVAAKVWISQKTPITYMDSQTFKLKLGYGEFWAKFDNNGRYTKFDLIPSTKSKDVKGYQGNTIFINRNLAAN